MECWKQCTLWLINCKVLPSNHRVTEESAGVFDFAQTLRDGVLLCKLLNNLRPNTINFKEINLRPQMSQFLCLKNIQTFLFACHEVFGVKKTELFEDFDLFDVRDFGKVIETLSKLSQTDLAQQVGIRPFPTEESFESEDIYVHLADQIDEQELEDVYDLVYGDDEGGDVYEDLMRTDVASLLKQTEVDIRSYCLSEMQQTEEKYTETLESIEKYFMIPLKKFVSPAEITKVFVNIPDLIKVHRSLVAEIQDSIQNKNASNLYQIFLVYKERLLVYGVYCSHIEMAIAVLDDISKEREDVRLKLGECAKRANNGKFALRDLLVVPMQRVLKYPLLLQELVKHTHDCAEKNNLRIALDAMKDLAQYVNEVKRDNDTLREIDQYQRSIENLNRSLMSYGRPKGDGEVRLVSMVDRRRQDRHIFLFDVAVIVCKRRGDSYEMKEVIDLNHHKITNNLTAEKDCKKWSSGFCLTHQQGTSGFELFFKTRELQKKWLEQFHMAISNIRPEHATRNRHQFRMHTFERITACSSCHLLLRGIFNQGYLCAKCSTGAHKECLGRLGVCGQADAATGKAQQMLPSRRQPDPGLPKMLAIRAYCGIPCPEGGPPLTIQTGDVIEVIFADLETLWWQVPRPMDYSAQPWFAGPMERLQAEAVLKQRSNSSYLIRHRGRENSEYAISIKFNDKVRHIKILTKDGRFYITESRTFNTVLGLVEFYKQHSLREGFRSLDTTLQVPYKEQGNGVVCRSNVFSPRAVGTAVARYDFSSRDTRELSLQAGDLVKIFCKRANGWWRGEANSRVGWFPSTYVEEE